MQDTLMAAGSALAQIADPFRFMMLTLGVLMGLALGVVPGLGGLVGLTLVLPFTFHMDPYTALAVLIGLHAVVATSDSIPAILFGVPGTVGSAATVLDGYPMSKNGQAGRALGAAFTSCLLGGVFGAILLALTVPMLRPFMLYIGSPEMLSFCVFGLSFAAALSGKHMLRGLAVACVGLMLAMIGEDYQSGTMRWTFGSLYLWEGVPLVPVALGLFALPELADLAIRRVSITGDIKPTNKGQFEGFMDVMRNPVVLLRSSTIGVVLGILPGLGSAVIDWIAYGSAARSNDPNSKFGAGDVRGVIASESANNAKEGGSLVPTIAFGVPGSAAMAILLGAFLVQGIVPGPDMLTKHLDITYTMTIGLAIANIIGAGVCFLFAPHLARIAMVPIGFLAPVVLAVTFIGAFQGEHHWGDLVALLAAGALGYVMRLLHWPRPPLLLGFVLGALIERYMATSVQIFGAGFLTRPVVVVMLVLTVWGILTPLWPLVKRRITGKGPTASVTWGLRRDRLGWDLAFGAALLVLFVAVLWNISGWPMGAKLMPLAIAIAGTVLMGIYVVTRLFATVTKVEAAESGNAQAGHLDLAVDKGELSVAEFTRRGFGYFGWLIGYAALAFVIGPLPAVTLWVAAYMILGFGVTWWKSIVTGLAVGVVGYLLFERLLNTPWPQSMIQFF